MSSTLSIGDLNMKYTLTILLAILLLAFNAGCSSRSVGSNVMKTEPGEDRLVHSYCYQYLYGSIAHAVNYGKAFHWCQLGSERKISASQVLLAEMYFLGLHVDQDYLMAHDVYLLAAHQGHAHAQWMLYQMYVRGLGVELTPSIAQEWLTKASSNGHEGAKKQMKNL